MKICVLFGSFNPLTNAHVTALRAAVNAIGADKGLFVATNGQYLKRKTVKDITNLDENAQCKNVIG